MFAHLNRVNKSRWFRVRYGISLVRREKKGNDDQLYIIDVEKMLSRLYFFLHLQRPLCHFHLHANHSGAGASNTSNQKYYYIYKIPSAFALHTAIQSHVAQSGMRATWLLCWLWCWLDVASPIPPWQRARTTYILLEEFVQPKKKMNKQKKKKTVCEQKQQQ